MIVMKFGGTSVQDAAAIRQVVNIINSKVDRQPVVVCSAAAGITDTLLRSCELAHEGTCIEARELIDDAIVGRHNAIITHLIQDSSLRKSTLDRVASYANEIKSLLDGLIATSELSARSLDLIMSYGELLSTAILSAAMKEFGLESELVDARRLLITDDNHSQAAPLMDICAMRSREILLPIVEAGAIPVTQGFIGSTLEGATTTLGRNGSDYSAAIIGSSCGAEAVEIWTDVDGILTADPKLVPDARLLETVTFQEAAEMAYFGAKVLHPNTTKPLLQNKIPVHVYNTKRPQSPGTRVVVSGGGETQPGRVKTIAYRSNITVINIQPTRIVLDHSCLKIIIGVFNKFATRIYIVKKSESNISIAIDDIQHIDVIVDELRDFSTVTVEHEKAVVCLIGEITQDTQSVVARAFSTIGSLRSDRAMGSASEISVSFVVNQSDLEITVQRLHREFFGEAGAELNPPIEPCL